MHDRKIKKIFKEENWLSTVLKTIVTVSLTLFLTFGYEWFGNKLKSPLDYSISKISLENEANNRYKDVPVQVNTSDKNENWNISILVLDISYKLNSGNYFKNSYLFIPKDEMQSSADFFVTMVDGKSGFSLLLPPEKDELDAYIALKDKYKKDYVIKLVTIKVSDLPIYTNLISIPNGDGKTGELRIEPVEPNFGDRKIDFEEASEEKIRESNINSNIEKKLFSGREKHLADIQRFRKQLKNL